VPYAREYSRKRREAARLRRLRSWVRRKLRLFRPPADEALCGTTVRRKRNPKSTPERLAYAREYKRQCKAGNPNAAVAARAAAQGAKRTSGG
jgi:hypothetical protein